MSDAFFRADTGPGESLRFVPTDHVRGPWAPDFMHAGPPSALLAHVIFRVGGDDVPIGGLMTSVHFDILRPVPVKPVVVHARVARAGRRVALVEAALTPDGGDEPVMLARAWVMRTKQIAVPATRLAAPPDSAGRTAPIPAGWSRGYLDAVDWRWVEGSFESAGPATVWARPRIPLLVDRPLAPVERVLLVADSGSGISAVANPQDLIFINTDLTVHLYRPPVGDRVWLRSETRLEPDGVGLASTILGDEAGAIGSGEQSLFLAPGPAALASRGNEQVRAP